MRSIIGLSVSFDSARFTKTCRYYTHCRRLLVRGFRSFTQRQFESLKILSMLLYMSSHYKP